MADIHDEVGNKVATVTFSPQDQAVLDSGGKITLHFHTPISMRNILGPNDFTVTVDGSGPKLKTDSPDQFRRFVTLHNQVTLKMAADSAKGPAPGTIKDR